MEKEVEKITPYSFKTFGDEEKLHNLFEFKKLEKGNIKKNVEKNGGTIYIGAAAMILIILLIIVLV